MFRTERPQAVRRSPLPLISDSAEWAMGLTAVKGEGEWGMGKS